MQIPPAASYTLRRLGLFLATLALSVALLRNVSFFLALVVATVVSSALSYVLLAGPREAMARSVAGLGSRLDAGAAAEDAALDAAEAQGAGSVPQEESEQPGKATPGRGEPRS